MSSSSYASSPSVVDDISMANKSRENSAVWERDLKIIFCDLCIKEVELGNRPTTHFNKVGWTNLTNGFKEKTGREYDKAQLKNKLDNIKKDWKLWKELKRRSTGLRWCNIRKTIDAPDEWWKEKIEVLPAAKKFRYSGIDLELEDKLDKMFSGVVAMGLNARSSNMETTTLRIDLDDQQSKGSLGANPHDAKDANATNAPTNSRTGSASKRKRDGSQFIKDSISSLVSSYSSIAKGKCSRRSIAISEAIKLLKDIPTICCNKKLMLDATCLLENSTKRAFFIAIPPELRADYIRFQLTGEIED